MILYLFMMFIPMILIFILIFINYYLSMSSKKDREKPSPFECGFMPLTNPRMPFSIQFFIISIIFLIFDIEIIILIPLIPSMKLYNLFYWMNSFLIILMILFIGLFYEWNESSILWIN